MDDHHDTTANVSLQARFRCESGDNTTDPDAPDWRNDPLENTPIVRRELPSKTADLTNRLRERAADAGYPKSVLYNEAADEIERLRGENVDLHSRVTVLSPEAWKRFVDTLDNPPEPTEALRKLLAEAPSWFRNAGP